MSLFLAYFSGQPSLEKRLHNILTKLVVDRMPCSGRGVKCFVIIHALKVCETSAVLLQFAIIHNRFLFTLFPIILKLHKNDVPKVLLTLALKLTINTPKTSIPLHIGSLPSHSTHSCGYILGQCFSISRVWLRLKHGHWTFPKGLLSLVHDVITSPHAKFKMLITAVQPFCYKQAFSFLCISPELVVKPGKRLHLWPICAFAPCISYGHEDASSQILKSPRPCP